MAVLTVQKIATSGLVPSYAACAGGGDSVPNNGRVVLHVKNAHSSPQSVTVDSVKPCDQGSDHDVVVSVVNATERIIGPFPVDRFGKNLAITYSGVTALTIAALDPS